MSFTWRSYLLAVICTLSFWHFSSAQSQQQKNEAAFQLVKKYINNQNSDSLYEMVNEDFRMKISRPSFDGVFSKSVFPLGQITETTYLKFGRGISDYKISFNTFVMVIRLGVDKAGKLFALEFAPFKGAEPQKGYAVPTTNPLQSAQDKKVDSIAKGYIMKLNTVGMCIGVLKDGVMTTYGYGETAKGNKKIPDQNTIFEIGSVSKTFTATLLAYYAEQHKVVADYPITKYLPDSVAKNVNLSVISLMMLSNHTSGLPRMPDNWAATIKDSLNPLKDYKRKDLFSYAKMAKLEGIPGQTYAYSNLGAGMLGAILERVSGKSYEQMVKQVICEPLKMTSTEQHLTPDQKARFVSVYNDKGEAVKAWDLDALAGAGGLRSTIHDMLLFAQANMSKKDDALSKAMRQTQKITYDKKPTMGMAWMQEMLGNTPYYWHNGATGGCYSYIAFIPEKGIAVVVLTNSAEDVDPTGDAILAAVGGK
jgi:CubicO group peptidase (beta-lactamase class C family)